MLDGRSHLRTIVDTSRRINALSLGPAVDRPEFGGNSCLPQRLEYDEKPVGQARFREESGPAVTETERPATDSE